MSCSGLFVVGRNGKGWIPRRNKLKSVELSHPCCCKLKNQLLLFTFCFVVFGLVIVFSFCLLLFSNRALGSSDGDGVEWKQLGT